MPDRWPEPRLFDPSDESTWPPVRRNPDADPSDIPRVLVWHYWSDRWYPMWLTVDRQGALRWDDRGYYDMLANEPMWWLPHPPKPND